MANAKDLYMNFKSASLTLNASNSTTLEEEEIETRMSIRGEFCWLIHLIEWFFPAPVNSTPLRPRAALSSQSGLSTFPSLADKGLIALVENYGDVLGTDGGGSVNLPMRTTYLPPIPYANPDAYLYANSVVDSAQLRSAPVAVRIGFTTEDLDNLMYAEIQEVWAW